ncbi:lactococcin 972 family bacteriocin [Glycomyces sp. NPDC049804]|uniref:lactococcin 972 family bacteriocin n=1 Tax=Glycomyces sp. NPDC049804 TaxID=3154363 RepID=UPI0034425CCE
MKLKRILTTGAVAATFVIGAAAPALAESVGGGTWYHGVGGGEVWSDYYHGSSCHTASVNGAYFERATANAGIWARADAPDTIWVDEAYWNNRC